MIELVRVDEPYDWFRVPLTDEEAWQSWREESCLERHRDHLYQLEIDCGSLYVHCSYCNAPHGAVSDLGSEFLCMDPIPVTLRVEVEQHNSYWHGTEEDVYVIATPR